MTAQRQGSHAARGSASTSVGIEARKARQPRHAVHSLNEETMHEAARRTARRGGIPTQKLKGTYQAINGLRGEEGAAFLAIKSKKNFAFRYAKAKPEGGNGLWSW